MNLLGLDLGTSTGYCYNTPNGGLQIGNYELATPEEITAFTKERLDRRCDPRVQNLFRIVAGVMQSADIEAVVFEDVRFKAKGLAQAQLWPSFRTAVQLAARLNQRLQTIECVDTSALKKFACTGSATKEQMAQAALAQHPEIFKSYRLSKAGLYSEERQMTLNDDAIDAFFAWKWGQTHLAKVVFK